MQKKERKEKMPPKPKFSREEIIKNAFKIVTEKGVEKLTARELGMALGSSPRPIFTLFKNMDEVKNEVKREIMNYFENYKKDAFSDMPDFKREGMKMVIFGSEKPNLYRLLFMEEQTNVKSFEDIFQKLGKPAEESVKTIQSDYGLNRKSARMLFENMWIYTFGIGTLCTTKVCDFSYEEISDMLTAQFRALMAFVKENTEK